MEDTKRDSANKTKRTKSDPISQTVLAYLQKRNYPNTVPQEINPDELKLSVIVDCETGRPNSISYSCFNSEPIIIDHNFTKLIAWLKELQKEDSCLDLDAIVNPLFCHLYLEILQRGHEERASSFFKNHLACVNRTKCDEAVLDLINAISTASSELSVLKKNFRSNKFVLNLCSDSVIALKKFLNESCHIVMLQVLQSYFQIVESEEMDTNDGEVKIEEKIINGHAEHYSNSAKQKLLDAIAALKNEKRTPMFTVHLGNVKDEVTCGFIHRRNGYVIYSYNSGIFIKSLATLKQLNGAKDFNEEVVIREHTSKIFDFSVTKDNFLVSGSQDKTVRLFDLNDYSLKTVYTGHEYPVYCVSTSSNGFYIISGSYDRTTRLWCTNRKDTLKMYAGHTEEITSIDFHPNSLYFATGSADKTLRMWSINDNGPVRLFLGSKGVLYAVKFSSCGHYLASAGDDKRLRVWDLIAGKQILEIKIGSEPITKVTWSDDNKVLSAGSVNGVVRTWDVEAALNNPTDNNLQNPKSFLNLNYKLLDLEYCYDTFGCLTAQTRLSTFNTST